MCVTDSLQLFENYSLGEPRHKVAPVEVNSAGEVRAQCFVELRVLIAVDQIVGGLCFGGEVADALSENIGRTAQADERHDWS